MFIKSGTYKFKSINDNGSFSPLRHCMCAPNIGHFMLTKT